MQSMYIVLHTCSTYLYICNHDISARNAYIAFLLSNPPHFMYACSIYGCSRLCKYGRFLSLAGTRLVSVIVTYIPHLYSKTSLSTQEKEQQNGSSRRRLVNHMQKAKGKTSPSSRSNAPHSYHMESM